ncbi:MAG: PQQ-binding-like beta-propeller repeat protein [Planctomycetota bacterium]
MKRFFGLLLIPSLCLASFGADWAQFRGPGGASYAPQVKLPTTWKEGENVAWKVPLPGRGPASPIVVGKQVIVTCSAGPIQDRLFVVSYDAATGKQQWQRQFWATGRTYSHPDSANAAPTPTSDGQRIYAFFSSNDLICLDLAGNLLWYRGLAYDYPKAGNDVGMSSSPVVVGDTVVVQVENFGDSFAAGLDAATGETRWRLPRKASSNWASPAVLKQPGGRELVLLQSAGILTAHDPRTGDQVWQYEAPCQTIPSVVAVDGRVYIPTNGITALDIGDSSAPQQAWHVDKLTASGASPMIADGRVYTLNNVGVLVSVDAKTGKDLQQMRIGGRYWATPVIAGQHMYCIDQDGKARILKLADGKAELVGEAEFGEKIQGSPAVADQALFVRSDKHLWKISSSAGK